MRMTFDTGSASMRKRNHLPHLDVDGGVYFVTYCLDDAITPAFLRRHNRLRKRLREKVLARDGALAICDTRAIERKLILEVFAEMDNGRGSCVLADPRVAEIVVESLKYHDGRRYRLYGYCMMPNHVHVCFRAFPGFPWWQVVGSWKSYSARAVNRLLGRTGRLWQHDNFDRLVRDNRQLGRVVNYIARNPKKAGLIDWKWMEVLIGPPYVE